MSEEYIEMGEMEEATPASDEFSEDTNYDTVEETGEEAGTEIEEQPQERTVPFEVMESIREQLKDQRAQNQQLLQLVLSGKQQQQQQPEQSQGIDIADDEMITGAQLKAILQQQTQMSQQEIRQFQEQQRQVYIDEQKAAYQQKYPDYNDVLVTVQTEAQKDPAIAELIMRSKNPVDAAYKYGKLLRGEALTETATAKKKVSVENKITQNLNKAKTLNSAKTAPKTGDDDFDALYNKIKGSRW